MAEKALITRRAAFVGALASTAALAIPVAAAVTPEHPWAKARRLARDLSAALDEIAGLGMGEHVGVIYGHDHVGFADKDFYESQFKRIDGEPADIVPHYGQQMVEALCRSRPGLWRYALHVADDGSTGHVTFNRAPYAISPGVLRII